MASLDLGMDGCWVQQGEVVPLCTTAGFLSPFPFGFQSKRITRLPYYLGRDQLLMLSGDFGVRGSSPQLMRTTLAWMELSSVPANNPTPPMSVLLPNRSPRRHKNRTLCPHYLRAHSGLDTDSRADKKHPSTKNLAATNQ